MPANSSKASKSYNPSASSRLRPYLIVGVLLLQVAVAVVLILNRDSSQKLDSVEQLTAEEALARGSEAQSNGELDVAEVAYQQVLERDPENKIAFYNLGVLEETKGPSNRAEEYYQKALAVDPNFVPALFNMAVLRDAQGRPQESATLYRKVIELEPARAEAHLNLGFVLLRKLGQKQEGQSELLKAIVLDESLAARVPREELGS